MAQEPDPQELEKLAKEYQSMQEQLRVVTMQLDQLRNQQLDIERAQTEIEKSDGRLFISVGGVMVETTKAKATTDLKDRKELADTRLQSINKQYNDLKAKEKQLGEKIAQLYKQ